MIIVPADDYNTLGVIVVDDQTLGVLVDWWWRGLMMHSLLLLSWAELGWIEPQPRPYSLMDQSILFGIGKQLFRFIHLKRGSFVLSWSSSRRFIVEDLLTIDLFIPENFKHQFARTLFENFYQDLDRIVDFWKFYLAICRRLFSKFYCIQLIFRQFEMAITPGKVFHFLLDRILIRPFYYYLIVQFLPRRC